MTKPKNIRRLPQAHISSGLPLPAADALAATPLAPARLEVGAARFGDLPGMLMLRLLVEGKEVWIPARQIGNLPGWAAIQLEPQFLYFNSEADAEIFHQQQVQQYQAQQQRQAQVERQAKASALWTPDKARKGLVN